ncbi:MAG: OmpH family outer membrane protein [Pseudomonadota bacterium]
MKALLAALLLLMAGPVVWAQEEETATLPPAVVAVIDYQRILRDSSAAVSIREGVDERRVVYEDEIAVERTRLEEADRALNVQRPTMELEAYRERRRSFEADVAGVQRLVQERRRELDEASTLAFQAVRDEVVLIIGELGDRYAFNVVLPRSDVLVFSPDLDLTEQVLDILDARLPEIDLGEIGG